MSDFAIIPPSNPFSTSDGAALHKVSLAGLCSANGGADEPCYTIAIAINRISVQCAAGVSFGDKVMFSFADFGLVEATVTATFHDGFDACFEPSIDSKLALYVGCLQDKSRVDDDDRRIVPVKKITTLGLEGEPESMARIVDLSRSAVSVTTSRDLAPEQSVIIGPRTGHVVELFEGGAVVEFDELIPAQDFDPLIDLRSQTEV